MAITPCIAAFLCIATISWETCIDAVTDVDYDELPPSSIHRRLNSQRTHMKALLAILLAVLTAGCAAPAAIRSETLFNDSAFLPPAAGISAKNIFSVNDNMRNFLRVEIAPHAAKKGAEQALFDALYAQGQLKLEYDSGETRNASEAFEARSGNCLSMAIMTAALAKELGMTVKYRKIFVKEAWSRSGSLFLAAGHVNVTLLEKPVRAHTYFDLNRPMTIDFIPISEVNRHDSEVIEEDTIVAMYMNNRAAESLAQGKLDDAYWWARGAIVQDPQFTTAYNTLGVIYRKHGNLREAEAALRKALERDSHDVNAMSNLAQLLKHIGKMDESNQLMARVERVRPYGPYYFFDLGQAAMKNRQYKEARDLFAKEVEREPISSEFNFWLAAAYFNLGEVKPAGKYMAIAMENSTTRAEYSLYAAKLNAINAKQRASK